MENTTTQAVETSKKDAIIAKAKNVAKYVAVALPAYALGIGTALLVLAKKAPADTAETPVTEA